MGNRKPPEAGKRIFRYQADPPLEEPMADYLQKPVANHVLLTELERGI